MQRVRDLIAENAEEYPGFVELFELINVAQNEDSTPDTILDCALSLLEGVGKNIIGELDDNIDARQCRKLKPDIAVRLAVEELGKTTGAFESNFVSNLIAVVSEMKTLRNARGEISHGHLAPKDKSPDYFSELVSGFATETCLYLLRHFFEIEPEVSYSKYPDLNSELDELGSPIGGMSHSMLLYEHDFPAYEAAYDEYEAREELND